jgi:hypothetical protein
MYCRGNLGSALIYYLEIKLFKCQYLTNDLQLQYSLQLTMACQSIEVALLRTVA